MSRTSGGWGPKSTERPQTPFESVGVWGLRPQPPEAL
jgi:hypothetical protein